MTVLLNSIAESPASTGFVALSHDPTFDHTTNEQKETTTSGGVTLTTMLARYDCTMQRLMAESIVPLLGTIYRQKWQQVLQDAP